MPEVRLIDANVLHARICEDSEHNYGASANIAQILLQIETAPTIEAEPVRHGRWIPHKITSSSICSECRRVFADETLFCPNCGAKMDSDHIADDSKKVGGADNG